MPNPGAVPHGKMKVVFALKVNFVSWFFFNKKTNIFSIAFFSGEDSVSSSSIIYSINEDPIPLLHSFHFLSNFCNYRSLNMSALDPGGGGGRVDGVIIIKKHFKGVFKKKFKPFMNKEAGF